jgi:L-lactate dehydrogenase (cytochrome)
MPPLRSFVAHFKSYVNHDRAVTSRLIQKAKAGGVKAVAVTVDAPQLGRREKDMRGKFELEGTDVQKPDDTAGKIDRSQVRTSLRT